MSNSLSRGKSINKSKVVGKNKEAKEVKRESHPQSSRSAKSKQAKAIGSRDRYLSERFIELVRSQMFHRK